MAAEDDDDDDRVGIRSLSAELLSSPPVINEREYRGPLRSPVEE